MDLKDAFLNDVLKIFSKQSGLNFISATDVSAMKVTVFLDNIPAEEALEKILDANNLTYEITADSNVFIVKQKENILIFNFSDIDFLNTFEITELLFYCTNAKFSPL